MTETQRGSTPWQMTDPPDHYDVEAQRHPDAITAPEAPAPLGRPPRDSRDGAVVTATRWEQLPLVLDAPPVARLMGCSMNTLYELCRQGVLPARRVGRQWRFSRDLLRRYIEGGAT